MIGYHNLIIHAMWVILIFFIVVYSSSPFLIKLLSYLSARKELKRICQEIDKALKSSSFFELQFFFRCSSVTITSINQEKQEFYFYPATFFRRPFAEEVGMKPEAFQATLVAMDITLEEFQELVKKICKIKLEIEPETISFAAFSYSEGKCQGELKKNIFDRWQ